MAANQTGYTLTLIPDSYDVFGKTRTVLASIAPTSSSYYTGGYLITPQNVGFRLITDATYSGTLPGSGDARNIDFACRLRCHEPVSPVVRRGGFGCGSGGVCFGWRCQWLRVPGSLLRELTAAYLHSTAGAVHRSCGVRPPFL